MNLPCPWTPLRADVPKSPVIVSVKLAKGGKPAGESVFPLAGDCPDEEDISIEGSDKGFTIKCPYCERFLPLYRLCPIWIFRKAG